MMNAMAKNPFVFAVPAILFAGAAAFAADATPDTADLQKQLADVQDKLSTSLHSYSLLQDQVSQLKADADKSAIEKSALATELDAAKYDDQRRAQAAEATQVDSLRGQLRQTQDALAVLASENPQLRTRQAVRRTRPRRRGAGASGRRAGERQARPQLGVFGSERRKRVLRLPELAAQRIDLRGLGRLRPQPADRRICRVQLGRERRLLEGALVRIGLQLAHLILQERVAAQRGGELVLRVRKLFLEIGAVGGGIGGESRGAGEEEDRHGENKKVLGHGVHCGDIVPARQSAMGAPARMAKRRFIP